MFSVSEQFHDDGRNSIPICCSTAQAWPHHRRRSGLPRVNFQKPINVALPGRSQWKEVSSSTLHVLPSTLACAMYVYVKYDLTSQWPTDEYLAVMTTRYSDYGSIKQRALKIKVEFMARCVWTVCLVLSARGPPCEIFGPARLRPDDFNAR
jgi:hypothetical protein